MIMKNEHLIKQNLLIAKYSEVNKYYRKWLSENHNDDRKLFINMANRMLEAINEINKINNVYIESAFNKKFKKDYEKLQFIIKKFKNK